MILYVDCIGGVAGDMLLAALLDAGADREAVDAAMRATGTGIALGLDRVTRHGISALHADVRAGQGLDHAHRRWSDVRAIIDEAGLGDPAWAWAHDAFRRLATAEARVHGIEPEDVHFHEVGALDAIADVVGVCVAAATLGADRFVCSPLPVARGLINAAHGVLPLPAPAMLELLRERQAPLVPATGADELVTPTGAALVAALATSFGPFPEMTPLQIGYGAGTRDTAERPNLVRVVTGTPSGGEPETRPLHLLETNLDDLTPELVPDAAAAAMAAGAVDVWTTPVQMKKGRPGFVLAALARPADRTAVARSLLVHTSTLGVRTTALERYELERDWATVDAGDGPIRIKRGWLDSALVQAAPEHDDCAQAAQRSGRPVREVWARALAAATAVHHRAPAAPSPELTQEAGEGHGDHA